MMHGHVACMVMHVTRGRMRRQATLTREGIEQCVPREILALFSERELAFIIAGNPNFDVYAWRDNCKYNNETGCEQIIAWFWKFVEKLTQLEKGLLFRFATGSSRLPPGGFASLTPKFVITFTQFDGRKTLPTAATCFNQLKLPKYPNEGLLKKCMLTAILHGSEGFTML